MFFSPPTPALTTRGRAFVACLTILPKSKDGDTDKGVTTPCQRGGISTAVGALARGIHYPVPSFCSAVWTKSFTQDHTAMHAHVSWPKFRLAKQKSEKDL